MAKKEVSTVGYYKRWKAFHWTLWSGKYVAPCVPAAIITGIRWDEWFNQSGASLPFGFATLLVAVISTIAATSLTDKVIKKNVSPLFLIAAILAVYGIAAMFLANILQQIGELLMWTVVGVLSAGTMDEVDKLLAEPRIEEYKENIEKNQLDPRSKRREERRKKAEEEARKEAEEHQATE